MHQCSKRRLSSELEILEFPGDQQSGAGSIGDKLKLEGILKRDTVEFERYQLLEHCCTIKSFFKEDCPQ